MSNPNTFADSAARSDKFDVGSVSQDRKAFLGKTYLHLFGAISAFVLLQVVFLVTGLSVVLLKVLTLPFAWILLMLAFIFVASWANNLARSESSVSTQYMGLGLYTLLEAVFFAPIILFAVASDPTVLPLAAGITIATFGLLSSVVYLTGQNFSFLRNFLVITTLIALVVVIVSTIFGFSLGILFSGIMVIIASGWILYDTSKMLHEYRTTQHVAAALELFSSLMLLFWYILRILMGSRRS